MTSDSLEDLIARCMARPQQMRDEAKAREHEAYERRQREEVLRRVGVPQKCIVALGELERSKSIQYIDELDPATLIVVLSGGVGVGKSVAAAYWLQCKLGHVSPGPHMGRRWYLFGRLPAFGAELDEACRVGTAVLDDVGTEGTDEGGRMRALLDNVVNERHSHRRATCITTNLDAPRFRERYGERVYDRLRGDGVWFSVAGKSRR